MLQIRYHFRSFLHHLKDLTYLTLFIVAKVLISPNWRHLAVCFVMSFISLNSPSISLSVYVLHNVNHW